MTGWFFSILDGDEVAVLGILPHHSLAAATIAALKSYNWIAEQRTEAEQITLHIHIYQSEIIHDQAPTLLN